jgi:aspartyl protease family protein
MGRWYLLIIIIGVAVGALLPSGKDAVPPPPPRGINGTFSTESRPHIQRRLDRHGAGNGVAASALTGPGITLDRSDDGHFYADAAVNGTTIRFMVDTGASGVALSAEDAAQVGLPFNPGEFSSIGHGASGEVRGKMVTLGEVRLGDKSVQNVSGAILEGSRLSLLGQSFLGQMGTIEISGDRMVIR